MRKEAITIEGIRMPLVSVNTLIVGSGAAALKAAISLHELGQEDVLIVTENWGGGTSRNAGSDKQTYYKLSVSGDAADSPCEMAKDLFAAGSMHGDVALCEAQHSAQAFYYLVKLGVPFPHDRYGGYVGYKTDHDPKGRGTSAGPLTSKLMFEALAKEVQRRGMPVLDRHPVIALLGGGKGKETHVEGAVALDEDNPDSDSMGLVVFNAVNVVLGTGGPAGMYQASVYPESQSGSTGMAFKIGAAGQNLTESQFGLASIKFRWNVSGSYQQVIPRYVSTDVNGGDERDFLEEVFPDIKTLATAIFLKGYQWPFDPRKALDYGSSLIDLLVYRETVERGRRVFLDYRRNPGGRGEFSFEQLDKEAYGYLDKSNALLETSIERLKALNRPAVDLYKEHGIDLEKDNLEIAVCAQHNNGGLKGNIWWESNVRHLFPVGEVNGSHGVYRPGGAALNAGQVGGLRAAMYISKRYNGEPPDGKSFARSCTTRISNVIADAHQMLERGQGIIQAESALKDIRARMSRCAAIVRNRDEVRTAAEDAWAQYTELRDGLNVSSSRELPRAFKLLDLCLTHAVYLEAIAEYLERGGKSRGSYLVLDPKGEKPCEALTDEWSFSLCTEEDFISGKILEVSLNDDATVNTDWVDVRPIPKGEAWFEAVWKDYREDKVIK